MGSMRANRKKKKAKEWSEFQALHQLSDEVLQLARQMGIPLKLFVEKLAAPQFEELSMGERIQSLHATWETSVAHRRALIEAGELPPKKKKQPKKAVFDPLWAKAKKLCRLNADDVRQAKELGMSPKSLIKNIPSPAEHWKQPVKDWIRHKFANRSGGSQPNED